MPKVRDNPKPRIQILIADNVFAEKLNTTNFQLVLLDVIKVFFQANTTHHGDDSSVLMSRLSSFLNKLRFCSSEKGFVL